MSKIKTETLPWRLKQGTQACDLVHSKNCLAQPKISVNEALLMTQPTSKGRSAISMKSTAANIAKGNKIPISAVSRAVGQY